MYQELICDLRPDLIVETGTFEGASAFYFATLLDLLGDGEIITIDITEQPGRPVHPRITYVAGSSTDDDVVAMVRARGRHKPTVMVILDSDHTAPHVRRELELYSPLVTPGSYLVVEDTNVNGHPVFPEFGPGPMEAVVDFLAATDEFEVDQDMERHLVSFNPNGWLRRRSAARPRRRAHPGRTKQALG
jgi:cephalosporin hydroxylase